MSSQSKQPPDSKDDEAMRDHILSKIPDPHASSRQVTNHGRNHDDWENILRYFGVPRGAVMRKWTAEELEGGRFRGNPQPGDFMMEKTLAPDFIDHSWDYQDLDFTPGGTDFLCVGPPGSGKTNWALNMVSRLMERNDEKVVWRASLARSEWIALAPWACVCLPAGVDVRARFESKDPNMPAVDVELEDVVREVVRYETPDEINHDIMKPGQFHVVYPDPKMRGLQEVYDATPEKQYEGLEFAEGDPLNHWWFGYVLSRIERGPHHWTSLMFDEVGDIAPESARNDEYAHYQKIELFKDCMVDARKLGLSIFMFGHAESDIHSMIRRKVRWRVAMPGTANPTNASQVVGFNNVPMNEDIMSGMEIGRAMPWNESRFEYPPLEIGHYPSHIDHTLKLTYT